MPFVWYNQTTVLFFLQPICCFLYHAHIRYLIIQSFLAQNSKRPERSNTRYMPNTRAQLLQVQAPPTRAGLSLPVTLMQVEWHHAIVSHAVVVRQIIFSVLVVRMLVCSYQYSVRSRMCFWLCVFCCSDVSDGWTNASGGWMQVPDPNPDGSVDKVARATDPQQEECVCESSSNFGSFIIHPNSNSVVLVFWSAKRRGMFLFVTRWLHAQICSI